MKNNQSYHRFDSKNYEFNSASKKGVYIIHGFSSTTYEVKELAEFLGDNGYHTIANNLPGHGTTVEECNRVQYQQWMDTIEQEIATLSTKCDKIFVIGNSMGAVLSLYIASIFPINGFVVGGTVLKFNNPFEINFLIPLLNRFIPIRKKKKVNKSTNVKFYGYKSYPLVALNQFRKMNKIVMLLLKKIKIPGLAIHSNSDRMSLKINLDILETHIKAKYLKKLIVEKAHHNLFDKNPDQKLIFNEVLQFLNSH